MNALYIETSALLSWLLGEPNSKEVIKAINAAEQIVTSSLTIVETFRALIRADAEKLITPKEHQKLKGLYQQQALSWFFLEMNESVLKKSSQPFPVEPIRSLDAIHLASILELCQIFPDMKILSFDKRILANLPLLGLIEAAL